MQYLVTKVRKNIGDLATVKIFTDDEIEQQLDIHRRDIAYVPLVAVETRTPTTYSYKKFYAVETPGYWETDAEFVDGIYNVVTPTSFDAINGVWQFSSGLLSPNAFASGRVFDINAASADLLETWYAQLKTQFSFARGQRSFQRGEQLQAFKQSIDLYRSRSWITVTPFRMD